MIRRMNSVCFTKKNDYDDVRIFEQICVSQKISVSFVVEIPCECYYAEFEEMIETVKNALGYEFPFKKYVAVPTIHLNYKEKIIEVTLNPKRKNKKRASRSRL